MEKRINSSIYLVACMTFVQFFSLYSFNSEANTEHFVTEQLREAMQENDPERIKRAMIMFQAMGMTNAEIQDVVSSVQTYEQSLGRATGFTISMANGVPNVEIERTLNNVLFVDPGYGTHFHLSEGLGFPTIQGALDHIAGKPLSSSSDQKTSWIVNVMPGSYDESLTVTAGRLVTLNAWGRVTLGDGASDNFGSTTARSVTWYQNDTDAPTSVNPTLVFNSLSEGEFTATGTINAFYAGGWDISGNLNVENYGPANVNALYVNGVRVRGNVAFTIKETDTCNVYLKQCAVDGNWTDSNTNNPANNLLRAEECTFGTSSSNTVLIRDYGRIRSSTFWGPITQNGIIANRFSIQGPGFWNCLLKQTNAFAGSALFVYDEETRYLTTQDSVTAITNGGTGSYYAVTKNLIDASIDTLDWKESCRAATTVALSADYDNAAGTLTANPAAVLPTIDGVSLSGGQRVLVKDQASAVQNGIYTVTQATSPWILTRASDMDGTPAAEVSGGNYTIIEQGTTYIGTGWVLQGDGTLTLGTDNINWIQVNVGSIEAGAGMTKSSNTLNVIAEDATMTVNADSIQVNQAHAFDWSSTHTFQESVTITHAQGSNSKDTGALIVEGGVGVEENLNIGGNANVTGTISSKNRYIGSIYWFRAGLDVGVDGYTFEAVTGGYVRAWMAPLAGRTLTIILNADKDSNYTTTWAGSSEPNNWIQFLMYKNDVLVWTGTSYTYSAFNSAQTTAAGTASIKIDTEIEFNAEDRFDFRYSTGSAFASGMEWTVRVWLYFDA